MKIKVMQLIHLAFCANILISAGIVLLVNKEILTFDAKFGESNPIGFVAPIITAACLFLAPFIFNKIIQGIDETIDSFTKITKYQSALVVKSALLEGAALFNIIMCLQTANTFFLLFTALAFFVMWIGRPTLDKVCGTLNLQNSDLD